MLFAICILFVTAFASLWILISEFSYIDTRLVRGLYALIASQYNRKWQSSDYRSDARTFELFVEPVVPLLSNRPEAKVLDAACGTGRATLLLLSKPWFEGRVDAIDFTAEMLAVCNDSVRSLAGDRMDRVQALCEDLSVWAPPQHGFYDVIYLLEAMEFIPNCAGVIATICEAIKPGGFMVITRARGVYSWIFVGRMQSKRRFATLCMRCNCETVSTRRWRSRYDVVVWRRRPAPAIAGECVAQPVPR